MIIVAGAVAVPNRPVIAAIFTIAVVIQLTFQGPDSTKALVTFSIWPKMAGLERLSVCQQNSGSASTTPAEG